MDYTGDNQDTRMSQLRQPLVNTTGASNRNSNGATGSDQTMLSNDPAKRISANVSAGLNRRQEVELTQFERPVLDIEGMTNQHRRGQLGSIDINEEMQFGSSGFGGEPYKGSYGVNSRKLDIEDAVDSGLNSSSPYMLTGL